jgi:hypothetical protein
MGFLDVFRRSKVAHVPTVALGSLGEAVWSADEDSWQGKFEETVFFLGASADSPELDAALGQYAESMLAGGAILELVRAEVRKYAEAHPKYAAEVQALPLESVHFYKRKGALHMNCQLGYGADDRFWSLEFKDGCFTGMGCDT